MSREKTDMTPGVNIGKASATSINRAQGLGGGGSGGSATLSRDFRGQSPLRKLLGSKEHLDWLKIDLNAAKVINCSRL